TQGSTDPPPRITSNVKQNLQFLKIWKEIQRRSSSAPRPATSYRRKKVEKEDLPPDTQEIYRDPTFTLYHTNHIPDTVVPVLLVDGYNVCGYWMKLKKHFMNGRLDVARQKLVDELIAFSVHKGFYCFVLFHTFMWGVEVYLLKSMAVGLSIVACLFVHFRIFPLLWIGVKKLESTDILRGNRLTS
ncbi:unnamed protein product, partial [Linum tenue]